MKIIKWIIVAVILFLAIWFLAKARDNSAVVSSLSTSTAVTQTISVEK